MRPEALRRAALVLWFVVYAASTEAQVPVQQVLLLQSLERGAMPVDYLTSQLRVELDERLDRPVNIVQVVVSPTGQVGAPERTVVEFIRSIYADRRPPDLIVALAGPASAFARRYRAEVFPESPLLFAGPDERFLRGATLGDNEAAVTVSLDVPLIVDEILTLLPETRHVFMVLGSGPIGSFWRPELEREFKRYDGRLTFSWAQNLSYADILRRSASLPDRSAIFYVSFSSDAEGGNYADDRVLSDLHASANAPVFGFQSLMLGMGVVGGTMMSNESLGRNIADAAVSILNGAKPSAARVPPLRPGPPIFDWRELHRWGIPESRLPPGSDVRYRVPSLWQEYRGTVLAAVAVVALQSLLIVGLLYQRRARRKAELESRRHLMLAADADRRQTMSALAGSIAHELSQPLGAMILNAQTGRMLISADSAGLDTLQDILSDIESGGVKAVQIVDRHRHMLQGHQLEKHALDLHGVIRESLALVAHDMRTRQIECTMNLSPACCSVCGDQVLLQQVIVNLLMNAKDAMVDTPLPGRRITISTEVTATDVALSVRDGGRGLPADVPDALFTPFVTTKAHGLGIGLTITRTIVDAHGGTIDAQNNPDGGATFTVRLRRWDAVDVISDPSRASTVS